MAPKSNKKQKLNITEHIKYAPRDMPSEACRAFLMVFIARFYEENTSMALDMKYVRYGLLGIEKFQSEMAARFMDVLHTDEWHEDTCKPGYMEFIKQRATDALWNSKNLLTKYHKEHRADDDSFQDVILKADLFTKSMQPHSRKRNRGDNVGWWNTSGAALQEEVHRMPQLRALPNTAEVHVVDGITKRGGYATIRKVRIEGAYGIPREWVFAAKRSNQWQTNPNAARMEHFNEAMAVRISHPGVIRFFAIHAERHEGYAFWWNGGTLREMFQRDRNFPDDDIDSHILYAPFTAEEFIRARQLRLYRQKCTELA